MGDRRIMTTFCIGEAYYKFHQEKAEIIRCVFRKIGLALPINGSADHELDIKGFTGLEIGDWRKDIDLHDDQCEISEADDNNIEFVNSFE